MKIAALVALFLSGCGFSLLPHEYRPVDVKLLELPAGSPECRRISDEHIAWAVTGIVTGAAAGGSGVASALTGSVSRYATAGLGIGLSITAGTSTLLSSLYAARYSQECTQNTGESP